MIHFNILTLFPELVEAFFKSSILKRAVEKGLITYTILNIRDFSEDKHKVVDDTPYGGGFGMVIKPEPVVNALRSLTNNSNTGKVIILSAKGKLFNQEIAGNISKNNVITLICGRYEGMDERVCEFADEEISIGNYVLMGGEVASIVIIEAVSRLVPGVVGKKGSTEDESFSSHFLEYPQYTRPRIFEGLEVPDILISGNHKEIENWRNNKKIEITVKNRLDIIKNREKPLQKHELEKIKKNLPDAEIYVALTHYPVYNKNHEIVATATTNLDIHDIARVSKTYNIKKYFIITPVEGQKEYIYRIVKHWKEGFGFIYNSNRAKALNITEITDSLTTCIKTVKDNTNKELILVGTSATGDKDKLITINKLRKIIEKKALLLVFGTGWGLTEEIIKEFDFMLEPIYGLGDFNHLPVRSAISITLDRILGF